MQISVAPNLPVVALLERILDILVSARIRIGGTGSHLGTHKAEPTCSRAANRAIAATVGVDEALAAIVEESRRVKRNSSREGHQRTRAVHSAATMISPLAYRHIAGDHAAGVSAHLDDKKDAANEGDEKSSVTGKGGGLHLFK